MYTVIELVHGDIYGQVFSDEDLELAAELISAYDNTPLEFVIAIIIED